MSKDDRLYFKLTLDFPDSPKIAPLSDAAFRALVEMTAYSRRMLSDGVIPERIAKKFWPKRAVEELCVNDPERPSLVRVEGGYEIHDFSEHQTTRADIEAKREAGRKGGLAKARASKRVAGATESQQQTGGTTLAKSESESETELTRLNNVSHLPEREDGIDVDKVIVAVQKHCGRECGVPGAYLIIGTVMDRAKTRPKNKTAFVVKAIATDPFEFQKILDEAVAS